MHMSKRILSNLMKVIPHRYIASQVSLPSFSHIKQEYQVNLIQGKIHKQIN